VSALLDWLDADDVTRLDGAENLYYQGLAHPYECGNGPFLTIGQIHLVKGLNKGDPAGKGTGKGLQDALTIYSDGKININTAPRAVLQGLDNEIDGALADAIIEYRKNDDFVTINDLRNVPGMHDQLLGRIRSLISVKSAAFSIEAEGKANGAVARITAVLQRKGEETTLLYWKVL
jgi:general secretion pathway protein K